MSRTTKSISLVLISSSLILAGCAQPAQDEKDKAEHRGHSGGMHTSSFHSTGGSSTTPGGKPGAPSAGSSTRGGFGASGHSASSGS